METASLHTDYLCCLKDNYWNKEAYEIKFLQNNEAVQQSYKDQSISEKWNPNDRYHEDVIGSNIVKMWRNYDAYPRVNINLPEGDHSLAISLSAFLSK